MNLPPHVDVSEEDLHAIAQRFGLQAHAFARLPETGIFNAIYALGQDYVLRVPRDHPAHIDAAHREAIVVPAVRSAGVRTPRLVAFDDTLDLLPVPYTLYERVRGETFDQLHLEPAAAPEVWRELGRDLALVHTRVTRDDLAGEPGLHPGIPHLADPRRYAEQRAAEGYFTSSEERWLVEWLNRLAPATLTPQPSRLLHGDSQTTNVMVCRATRDYLAVLDWGSAGWGDMTWDFAGVPLRAVPFMLEGHREIAPLDDDDSAEARILWTHLQLALLILPRRPDPIRSWAERPLSMLMEIMRFFLESPGSRWSDLGPYRDRADLAKR